MPIDVSDPSDQFLKFLDLESISLKKHDVVLLFFKPIKEINASNHMKEPSIFQIQLKKSAIFLSFESLGTLFCPPSFP